MAQLARNGSSDAGLATARHRLRSAARRRTAAALARRPRPASGAATRCRCTSPSRPTCAPRHCAARCAISTRRRHAPISAAGCRVTCRTLPRAPSRLRLRMMSSQWGSLAPDGTLVLDLALVLGRAAAFEYVLVHELCHLIHADHSRRSGARWRRVSRAGATSATTSMAKAAGSRRRCARLLRLRPLARLPGTHAINSRVTKKSPIAAATPHGVVHVQMVAAGHARSVRLAAAATARSRRSASGK